MGEEMLPGWLAQVQVYDETGGFNNHCHWCYNCAISLHTEHKKNVNMAWIDYQHWGPRTGPIADRYAEQATYIGDARRIGEPILNHDCYTGISVIRGGLHYMALGNFGAYQHINTNSHGWTYVIWSQQGLPCIKPRSGTEDLTEEEYYQAMMDGTLFEEADMVAAETKFLW